MGRDALELFPLILIIAVPVTFLILTFVLQRYNRTVKTLMLSDSGEQFKLLLDDSIETTANTLPLQFKFLNEKNIFEPERLKEVKRERTLHFTGMLLIYVLVIALYALFMLYFFPLNDTNWLEEVPFPDTLQFSSYCFVAIYIYVSFVNVSLARGLFYYLLTAFFVVVLFENLELEEDAPALFYFVAMTALPVFFFQAFRLYEMKALGPWLLTFFTIGIGTIVLLLLGISYIRRAEGYDALLVFFVLLLLSSPYWLIMLGRFAMRVFVQAYEGKRLSDWMIKADVIFLMYLMWHTTIVMSAEATYWYAPAILLLFFPYKYLTNLGFRIIGGEKYGLDLVLLRVFGFRQRTELLIQNFTSFWRFIGTVNLIASSDVTSLTIEPHELYYFVTNRDLRNQFIKSEEDLIKAMQEVDDLPDPDGRYRINDFLCYKNTWQQAVKRILHGSEAVLMDLRTFNEQRKGCLFELGLLFQFVPLNQVLFVIDKTTDMGFLRMSMEQIWKNLDSETINRKNEANTVQFFRTKYIEVNPFELNKRNQSWYTTLAIYPKHLFRRIFFRRRKEIGQLTTALYLIANKS